MSVQVLATLYDLLAQSLHYPTEEFTGALVVRIGDLRIDLWQIADHAALPLALAAYTRELAVLKSQDELASLIHEYRRLFDPGLSQFSLHEHSHRADQDPAAVRQSVLCSYRAWAWPVPEQWVDRLDVELAFAAFLCRKANNTAQGRRAQAARAEFLADHLLGWALPLSASVRTETKRGFYRSVMTVMHQVLRCDGLGGQCRDYHPDHVNASNVRPECET